MHKQWSECVAATAHTAIYLISLLPLLAAPASAQPAQEVAAPARSLQSFLPDLPPSVVPPRVEAPYPCSFPHRAIYEHPMQLTVVKFTVTAQGRVTNASVVQASGSGVVDEAVRDCISGYVYAPAMRDGAPIDVSWAYEYSLTITKTLVPPGLQPKLPPGAPQGAKYVMMPVEKYRNDVFFCEQWHQNAPHGVLVTFDVEPDGSVKNASVAQGSGDATTDKDAIDCVSKRIYSPATRDGQPVEIRLTAELFTNH